MEIYAVQEAKGAQTRARAKFIEKHKIFFKLMDRIKKVTIKWRQTNKKLLKNKLNFIAI